MRKIERQKMYKNKLSFFSLLMVMCLVSNALFGQLLKVGIAGLSHDHVNGIMRQYKNGEVLIAGIAEGDQAIVDRIRKKFQIPDSLFYKDLPSMLKSVKPDIVMAFNAIAEHLPVVESCAPLGIPVMVEKPLATTVKDANRMASLANQYHIKLLTNYETTWYSSNQQIYEMVNGQKLIGEIGKMIVHSGHQGPKEIGCSADFLNWLTDPVKNGGGAVVDFGCYGANLMTWLMNGKAPISVSAVLKHIKPDVYPKVDDDATILLEYPGAIGIIEASWNWPFGIKDMEVFGKKGYLHALNGNNIEQRDTDKYYKVEVKPYIYRDYLSYISAVLKGDVNNSNDLSSLENNLIVVRILEAARQSAATGKKIAL